MCSPVMAKKVAPNSGTPHSLPNAVTCSWLIRFIHSVRCSPTKVAPAAMVASSQRAAAARFPRFIAWTAITMVRLLVSSAKVITLEKIMLGEKWNGVGQFGLETREYVYANIMAENVSESETMNSHIPTFFELVRYGVRPPPQSEPVAAVVTWVDIPSLTPKRRIEPSNTSRAHPENARRSR